MTLMIFSTNYLYYFWIVLNYSFNLDCQMTISNRVSHLRRCLVNILSRGIKANTITYTINSSELREEIKRTFIEFYYWRYYKYIIYFLFHANGTK